MSGHVLKVVRESLPATQVSLAEQLDVDVATVQGWETGRRPLSAVRTSELSRLKRRLIRLGAKPGPVHLLTDAIEADLAITATVLGGDSGVGSDHPLAGVVHQRRITKLIAWPLTNVMPPELRSLPRARRRRGPVAKAPTLSSELQLQFFDNLRGGVERSAGDLLLRRQATFLLGFDRRPSTKRMLLDEHRPVTGALGDPAAWLAARSSAIALSRAGDPEPLQHFIRYHTAGDREVLANLNYWAYYLGESEELQTDDSFVFSMDATAWSGTRMFTHLATHLDDPVNQELNIHSLWTLLLVRPTLARQHSSVRNAAQSAVSKLVDDDLCAQTKEKLRSVQYALRIAERE
ncbi:XRE family transcriptional regulator [Actinopolymorpha sp. B17G11]|uniref:helix-turn-helix domain-containing protein n=1 Tax=Actinopolymorpha sp. B17G11 TaxID=3160861 RepID=UPI0032E462ED